MSVNSIRKSRRTDVAKSNGAFSLIEILLAVSVLTVVMTGVTALLSLGIGEVSRSENDREAEYLLRSVKNCAASFPATYLKSQYGRNIPIDFGVNNTGCATGAAFTGEVMDVPTYPEIRLKMTTWGDSPETFEKTYRAFLTLQSTGSATENAVAAVEVTDGTTIKTLAFPVR